MSFPLQCTKRWALGVRKHEIFLLFAFASHPSRTPKKPSSLVAVSVAAIHLCAAAGRTTTEIASRRSGSRIIMTK